MESVNGSSASAEVITTLFSLSGWWFCLSAESLPKLLKYFSSNEIRRWNPSQNYM